eukprot:15330769-Ditylum_brightwellii.AAC.1
MTLGLILVQYWMQDGIKCAHGIVVGLTLGRMHGMVFDAQGLTIQSPEVRYDTRLLSTTDSMTLGFVTGHQAWHSAGCKAWHASSKKPAWHGSGNHSRHSARHLHSMVVSVCTGM